MGTTKYFRINYEPRMCGNSKGRDCNAFNSEKLSDIHTHTHRHNTMFSTTIRVHQAKHRWWLRNSHTTHMYVCGCKDCWIDVLMNERWLACCRLKCMEILFHMALGFHSTLTRRPIGSINRSVQYVNCCLLIRPSVRPSVTTSVSLFVKAPSTGNTIMCMCMCMCVYVGTCVRTYVHVFVDI